jgi:hypothetical protein
MLLKTGVLENDIVLFGNTRHHKQKDSSICVSRGVACGSDTAAPGGIINISNGGKNYFLHLSNFKLFHPGKGNSINSYDFLKFITSVPDKKKLVVV